MNPLLDNIVAIDVIRKRMRVAKILNSIRWYVGITLFILGICICGTSTVPGEIIIGGMLSAVGILASGALFK